MTTQNNLRIAKWGQREIQLQQVLHDLLELREAMRKANNPL